MEDSEENIRDDIGSHSFLDRPEVRRTCASSTMRHGPSIAGSHRLSNVFSIKYTLNLL